MRTVYAQMNTASYAAAERSGWFCAAMTAMLLILADIVAAMSAVFFAVPALGVRLCIILAVQVIVLVQIEGAKSETRKR